MFAGGMLTVTWSAGFDWEPEMGLDCERRVEMD